MCPRMRLIDTTDNCGHNSKAVIRWSSLNWAQEKTQSLKNGSGFLFQLARGAWPIQVYVYMYLLIRKGQSAKKDPVINNPATGTVCHSQSHRQQSSANSNNYWTYMFTHKFFSLFYFRPNMVFLGTLSLPDQQIHTYVCVSCSCNCPQNPQIGDAIMKEVMIEE